MPDESWSEDHWRSHYESVFASGDRSIDFPHDRHQVECFAQVLKWAGPLAGSTVLDFGCGWGQLSQMLTLLGAKVTGAEYLESQVGRLQDDDELGVDYVLADLTEPDEWPWPAASFDTVIACEVTYPGYSITDVMVDLWSLVRPGGRLVGVVANHHVEANRLMAGSLGLHSAGIAREGLANMLRGLPGVSQHRYVGLHLDEVGEVEHFDSRRSFTNTDRREPYRFAFAAVRAR